MIQALPPALVRLSPRQQDVLALAADGYTVKGIAAELRLSTHTVQTYFGMAFLRLGARSRAHAVRLWIEWKAANPAAGGNGPSS